MINTEVPPFQQKTPPERGGSPINGRTKKWFLSKRHVSGCKFLSKKRRNEFCHRSAAEHAVIKVLYLTPGKIFVKLLGDHLRISQIHEGS